MLDIYTYLHTVLPHKRIPNCCLASNPKTQRIPNSSGGTISQLPDLVTKVGHLIKNPTV